MRKFKLKKPPIAERWVLFEFDPNSNKTAWEGRQANELAESLKTQFPSRKFVWAQEFQITQAGPGEPIQPLFRNRLEAVRCENESTTEIFQIRDDQITFHQLCKKDRWPGFAKFIDRAIELLGVYTEAFAPIRIKGARLHDLDVIEIPMNTGPVHLDQYFTLMKDLPETPFGFIHGFSSQYLTLAPHDNEPFVVSLQQMPAADGVLRFHVDRDKQCSKLDASSMETLRSSLTMNHDFMLECFEAAFRQTECWMLFDPEDD